MHSSLQQQIGFTASSEAVSTDFVGSRQACVLDAQATIVNKNNCILYCWYDNEFGYSCQVVRCLEKFSGVVWPSYPKPSNPIANRSRKEGCPRKGRSIYLHVMF